MTIAFPLKIHWPEPVTWPQSNYKGGWVMRGSKWLFGKHCLGYRLPQFKGDYDKVLPNHGLQSPHGLILAQLFHLIPATFPLIHSTQPLGSSFIWGDTPSCFSASGPLHMLFLLLRMLLPPQLPCILAVMNLFHRLDLCLNDICPQKAFSMATL